MSSLFSKFSIGLVFTLLYCMLANAAQAQHSAQTVLHLLDYMAVDYAAAVDNGQIKNAAEYDEMREFATQTVALLKDLPQAEGQSQLLNEAAALSHRIDEKAPPAEIRVQASALRWAVIRTYKIQVAPTRSPDQKVGAQLYATHCAVCHGADGRGDGVAGKALDPTPTDFHDTARMQQRSAYGLYSTITLGVEGTGMASYQNLSEEERWALAFFVTSYAADNTLTKKGAALWREGKRNDGFATLANIATLSANEVRTQFGDDAVALQAYLRTDPILLEAAKPAPLDFATATLAKSLDAYRQGARAEAAQLAIQAYLEGFELAEASLSNVDAELMVRIERAMMGYRGSLQAGAPLDAVERQATALNDLLDTARAKLNDVQLSPTTAFVSALVILLREGAEAILVVAAILAFLARAGRNEARRFVHAGWIAALALGGVTWVVSNYLIEISGANREITEGVTALIAAVMLLYVGYWLHSKSHSSAWQKYIGEKVGGALSKGTVWALAIISFLAVYREAFETVLFYQALVAQVGAGSRSALIGGVAVATLLLAALAWVILRASVKLPIGLFFSVSGVVLLILAVVFTGQGIAALQEAGKIGAHSVNFISISMLGIYPTLQTLIAQAIVLLVCVFGFWWVGRTNNAATKAPT
ncbi:MAG: cytochrome c/FTR1 family iron permease [Candidatus Obscuribacterales bacterium]|nr:cytochrome c/FTR1 family iron permease [Steroidobacteraceae bacterium]